MKILNNRWIWVLFIIPIYNPTALQYIPSLTGINQIFQVLKLLSVVIMIIIYLCSKKYSVFFCGVCLFELIAVFTSLINGVNETKIYTNALMGIGVFAMTELAMRVDFDKFADALFIVVFSITLINFVLCLLFPKGLPMATLYEGDKNPLYLIAIDNGIIKELLPLMVIISYIQMRQVNVLGKRGKSTAMVVAVFGISFITLVVVGSATGLLAFLFFASLLFIFNNVYKKRIPYKVLAIVYSLFILVVVVLGSNLSFVSEINESLGRSGSFTGRTDLWKLALKMIAERPLFGYGYTSGNIEIWNTKMSSHNMFLELTIQGGLLLLTAFVVLTLSAMYNNKFSEYRYANIVYMGLFSYLVVGLMEIGISPSYYILLAMAFFPVFEVKKHKKTYLIL